MKFALASFSRLVRQAALLLASLLVLPAAMAADGLNDFRILYAELFSPSVTAAPANATQKIDDPLPQDLRFDAYGRRFELALELNAKVMGDPGATGTAYLGTLGQQPGSWARLTRIGDALYGLIWEGGELYVIEPVAEARKFMVTPPDASQGGNVIYRLSDTLIDLGPDFCSSVDAGPEEPASTGLSTFKALTDELKSRLVLQQAAGASLRLSLSALGDENFLRRYATAAEARDAVLVRLNNVDGIFSAQLGVEIDLRSVDVYDDDTDPFTATTVPGTLLTELGNLRANDRTLRADGLTHLFTGRNLDGNTVGIAYIDSLCRRSYGVGLTESRGRGATIESLIAAHEIGHNFGAIHDGSGACAATPSDQFIMAAQATSAIDSFSACSIDAMSQSLAGAACISSLPPPDAAVAFAAAPAGLALDQAFGWSVLVTNNGGQQTPAVTVEITLPAAIAVDDASVAGGSCQSGAGVVMCSLGPLEAGESNTVSMSLRVQSAGVFTVTATTAATDDTNATNNAATATLTVNAPTPPIEPAPVPVPSSNTGAAGTGGGGGGTLELLTLLVLSLAALLRQRRPVCWAACESPGSLP